MGDKKVALFLKKSQEAFIFPRVGRPSLVERSAALADLWIKGMASRRLLKIAGFLNALIQLAALFVRTNPFSPCNRDADFELEYARHNCYQLISIGISRLHGLDFQTRDGDRWRRISRIPFM
jgi:hypothetical protein